MEAIPRQLEQLRKSGQQRGSRSGPESRYLRTRGGFCLGFMAEVAVAEDYLVLAQRVHQQPTDNAWAAAMVERVERECGARPGLVLADSGHDNSDEIQTIEAGGSEAIIPDPLLAHEWMTGAPAPPMNARQQRRTPALLELRQKLRMPRACEHYGRRKALVEPVFGVLKQQRGMRQFRRRGLIGVGTEWALARTACNTRGCSPQPPKRPTEAARRRGGAELPDRQNAAAGAPSRRRPAPRSRTAQYDAPTRPGARLSHRLASGWARAPKFPPPHESV